MNKKFEDIKKSLKRLLLSPKKEKHLSDLFWDKKQELQILLQEYLQKIMSLMYLIPVKQVELQERVKEKQEIVSYFKAMLIKLPDFNLLFKILII